MDYDNQLPDKPYIVEASSISNPIAGDNKQASLNPGPTNNKHSRSKRLLIVIGVAIGLVGILGTLFAVVGVGIFSYKCISVSREVKAEEGHRAALLSNLRILNGQKTLAAANGNTDCVDGGVGSVDATATFKTSTTFTLVKAEVDNNLYHQGYRQLNEEPSQGENTNTIGSYDNSYFNQVVVKYRKSTSENIAVAYNLPSFYAEICSNGGQVCNNPDLKEIYNKRVASIVVTY